MKTGKTGLRLAGRTLIGLMLIAAMLFGCTKTQQVLTREPAAPSPPSLEGRWDLVSFGLSGSEAKILDQTKVFINFTNDGKITGSGGCNSYFGGWGYLEGASDTVRIWRTGATKMACEGPVMEQEHRFLEELTRASKVAIDGKELRLYYNEGRGVLRFTRGAP